ncbi:hypothetical protein [Telluribacter humicola]|uniref:hypothetical protein n=1 Tax=Telluribacter humicola TaxID=1720261 RepID=UPI001A96B107|nr:hypothetical protein [Telluribacter humicola]
MILPFSTHFKDGQPNYFVEKIMASLPNEKYGNKYEYLKWGEGTRFSWMIDLKEKDVPYRPDLTLQAPRPKLHTFRGDKTRRWKPGMTIHAVLFNRSKHYWQFSEMDCVGVQNVLMERQAHTRIRLQFGGPTKPFIWSQEDVQEIAKNDGFENLDQFEQWFLPKPGIWQGRLIHWTSHRY